MAQNKKLKKSLRKDKNGNDSQNHEALIASTYLQITENLEPSH